MDTVGRGTCGESDDVGYCTGTNIEPQSPDLGAAYVSFLVLMLRLIGYRPEITVCGGKAVSQALQLSEQVNQVCSYILDAFRHILLIDAPVLFLSLVKG